MIKKILETFLNSNKKIAKDHQDIEINNILKIKNIKNFDTIDSKNFVDIPASCPGVLLPLKNVGISHRKHKIKIKDIFDSSKNLEVEVNLEIFFDLPKNQRGLHMSRIEKAMQRYQNNYLDLKSYSSNLIKYAAELQNRNKGKLKLEFNYEKFINKNSSGRGSHEIIKILLFTIFNKNKIKHKLGMQVPFMNACPCPQRWSIREAVYYLRNLGFFDDEIYKIINPLNFGTHTNLGEATIIIEDLNNNLNYNDIYEILNTSVLIVRELLSGKDEFEFIKQSLIKEQFCEDVAREITKNFIDNLGNKLNPESLLEIEVNVNESIHFHNLRVKIKEKIKDIIDGLK
ncbi:MAG: GTP cyclohydrolase I FolE2 [Candidatus Parcubacteria bacterium]|nr:MAG: GTP cyclohydrolase I FolE2 [Candidatus Parcubacteria bacterium]